MDRIRSLTRSWSKNWIVKANSGRSVSWMARRFPIREITCSSTMRRSLTDAALTVAVRLNDGSVYASDFGRGDIAIHRDGYVRTTVELPPGTPASRVKELMFECRVSPPSKGAPWPHSGTCEIQAVTKVFQLQRDYTPGQSFWSTDKAVTLTTGRGVSFTP